MRTTILGIRRLISIPRHFSAAGFIIIIIIIIRNDPIITEQDESGVTAHFRVPVFNGAGGEALPAARGSVLIGCDGLKSIVRSQIYGAVQPRYMVMVMTMPMILEIATMITSMKTFIVDRMAILHTREPTVCSQIGTFAPRFGTHRPCCLVTLLL